LATDRLCGRVGDEQQKGGQGGRRMSKMRATKVLAPIHQYRRCQIDAAILPENSHTKKLGRADLANYDVEQTPF
jgi:hypothetical protein